MEGKISKGIASALAAIAALAGGYFLFDGNDGSSAPEISGLEIPAVSSSDEIIRHDAYVISYDSARRIPEWVAYELTSEETGGEEERNSRMFSMDPDYHGTQAMREDYSNSGWTKGHMAPAADFRWSPEVMDQTFYLTNVCPQDETLNANDWEYLERQVRRWAKEYGRVWVVTGPIVGNNGYGCIGERNVVIPDAFFKAVLACKGDNCTAIAFVMGNDDKRYFLADCAISIDDLERRTGLDFFPALDDAMETEAEKTFRLSDWGIRRKKASGNGGFK